LPFVGKWLYKGCKKSLGVIMNTADHDPKLDIQVLGTFSVTYNQHPIPQVNTPRLQSLLTYVLLHRDAPIHRQTIASLFWPETSDTQARTNLRRLLHQLKAAFPEISSYLLLEPTTLSWNTTSSYRLDLEEFENTAINAREISELQAAMELYSGDLLPHVYEDWLVTERERLGDSYENVLQRLAECLESEGDFRNAIRVVQQSLHRDPLREETYHQLMRLYARSGDRAGVQRIYQTCERVLASELGVEPGPETILAYQTWLQPGQRMQYKEILYSTNVILLKTNLAAELDSLIGRTEEIEQIKSLVTQRRLVTITGFGGVGKTRLALAAGREMYDYFPDGVFWVDLAPVEDSLLITHTFLSTLKVNENVTLSQFDNLSNFLKYKHLLLIVDNCEHLLKKVSELIVILLQTCPDLYILATSRVRLHTSGESVYPLQPLSIPDFSVEDASENASIQLFVERAQALLPTFKINEINHDAVIRICRYLNGIPLAIELAAGRIVILTPREIAQRLASDFRLLSGGNASLPRHQTLKAVLDWSYALLNLNEQILLRRLAIFAGAFTLEDAEAVVAGEGVLSDQVLETIANLVDHSLLSSDEAADEHFYRLHEITRQYAFQKLSEAGETSLLQSRHLHYYAQLAQEKETLLKGPYQIRWLKYIDREMGNFRAAIEWGLEQQDREEINRTVQMIGSLYLYWWMRSRLVESFHWVESALQACQGIPVPPVHISKILMTAATYYFLKGQGIASQAFMTDALEKAYDSGDLPTIAFALQLSGIAAMNEHRLEKAENFFVEGLQIARSLDDNWQVCHLLNELGNLVESKGDLDRAYQIHLEQLEIARKLHNIEDQFHGLLSLSYLLIHLERPEEASTFIQEALVFNQQFESPRGTAVALEIKAHIAFLAGRIEEAKDLVQESLAIYWSISDWNSCLDLMEKFALQFHVQITTEQAIRILSACHGFRNQYGMLGLPDQSQRVAVFLEDVKLKTKKPSVQKWWDEGHRLSLENVLHLVGQH
jgi:predicted ATPase/DNA-binding SARP family transcriptional activator